MTAAHNLIETIELKKVIVIFCGSSRLLIVNRSFFLAADSKKKKKERIKKMSTRSSSTNNLLTAAGIIGAAVTMYVGYKYFVSTRPKKYQGDIMCWCICVAVVDKTVLFCSGVRIGWSW
jgi:hypothetical protein